MVLKEKKKNGALKPESISECKSLAGERNEESSLCLTPHRRRDSISLEKYWLAVCSSCMSSSELEV